jgi:uncharacterized protein involved in exopolysaccharide biosynthesis
MTDDDATTKPTLETLLERINAIGGEMRGEIREFRLEVNKRFDLLEKKLDIVAKQVLDVQARESLLDERVEKLEYKPS